MHFDAHGNPAPYEVIRLTTEQFKTTFVDQEDKTQRGSIYAGYESYVTSVKEVTACGSWTQWIGGGYTTNKKTPSDIDVVNFLDEVTYLKMVNESYPFVTRRSGRCSKVTFKVDAYVVAVLDVKDPRYKANTEHWTNYWRKWFGKSREQKQRAIIELGVA